MALVKLKPRDRMLAVLYSEGLSYKEMAEATGIRFASVGKLLSRTLEKIEMNFKDQGYELY
jgi:RNA polymerase sigma-70 factor (ECF subfamily)